jgi:hypothetical protein
VSGYLETYGAGEERRNRIILWTILGLLAAIILSTILYFTFRFYSEEKRVDSFLAAVRGGDYQRAYSIWGCGDQHPCRDYAMNKFLEDWGPNGAYTPMASGELKYVEPCGPGLIYTIEKPGQPNPLVLYTTKGDPTLGFSPWALCPEKGVGGISLRKIRLVISRLIHGGAAQ